MPAKAGIQEYQRVTKHWTPAFAGETTFYVGITFGFRLSPETPMPRGAPRRHENSFC